MKNRRAYTPAEVAKLLKVKTGSVYRWMKDGLRPIRASTNPLLIYGEELKHFLSERQQRRKTKLNHNEFYCLKCRVARNGNNMQLVKTGKKIGKDDHEQLQLIAHCEVCDSVMRRFTEASPKRTN